MLGLGGRIFTSSPSSASNCCLIWGSPFLGPQDVYLRGRDTDGSDLSATQDWPDTERLLGSANVVPEALQRFARAAADFATHGKLGKLEFARDARGRPDVSAFDFTSMMRAESSARVQERHGTRLLLGLVGDCLVEVRAQCSLLGEWLSGFCVRRHGDSLVGGRSSLMGSGGG